MQDDSAIADHWGTGDVFALILAARGALPPLGVHVLTGESGPERMHNAARDIEEGRTHPVQAIRRKPL